MTGVIQARIGVIPTPVPLSQAPVAVTPACPGVTLSGRRGNVT
jgi:hypothetical protein